MRISDARRAIGASCFVLALLSTGAVSADSFAYMGTVAGEFGTIDLDTGAFTIVGNSAQTLAGMAVANGKIFASSYHVAGKLFTVNPTSGSLTLVGTTALVYDDFGSTRSGLYAVGTDTNLYAINSVSGAATLIGATGLSLGSWRSLSTNSDTLYFANGPNLYTLSTTSGAATLVGGMGGLQIGAMLEEGGKLYGGTDAPSLNVATLNTTTGLATVGPNLMGSSSPFYAIAPFPLPVLGDYNHNGVVDAADYTIWRSSLGQMGPGLAADGDGDNSVTQSDYNIWKANFGQHAGVGAGVGAAVPEPASLALLVLGALTLTCRLRVAR